MVASDAALFWASAAERESFVGGHLDSFCCTSLYGGGSFMGGLQD